MRYLALAALSSASLASAEPRPCEPTGEVHVQIDQRVKKAVKRATARTQLFANGAWVSQHFDTDGKLAHTTAGCLTPPQREAIDDRLHAARWKATRVPKCTLSSPHFTEYTVDEKRVYTERVCTGLRLDVTSQRVVEILGALVVPALGDDREQKPRPVRWDSACEANPLAKGCF